MLLGWSEIYENTEVLSPIDRETWRVAAEICKLGPGNRVLELASGKGAFAFYIAKRFGCQVECYDANAEFIRYATGRAGKLGLASKASFTGLDVNQLDVMPGAYDVGVCLGALYIFREAGWKVLMKGVKPDGFLVVSDLHCKKVPAPREVMDVFFEEEGQPLTLEDARQWYTSQGVKVLREEECSRKAWLEYYDLTKKMLVHLAKKFKADKERQLEIEEALREDRLVREHGEEYLGYTTFIMKKP